MLNGTIESEGVATHIWFWNGHCQLHKQTKNGVLKHNPMLIFAKINGPIKCLQVGIFKEVVAISAFQKLQRGSNWTYLVPCWNPKLAMLKINILGTQKN